MTAYAVKINGTKQMTVLAADKNAAQDEALRQLSKKGREALRYTWINQSERCEVEAL